MNALRRTALLAALITGLASGAAAFGAAEDPPAATDRAPDPYLGSWALAIDGEVVGPVTNVDGCNLRGELTAAPTGKSVTNVRVARCSFEFGQGMSERFISFLREGLQHPGFAQKVELTRVDLAKPYALELTNAQLAQLSIPPVRRASATAVFVKAELYAESLRRVERAAAPLVRRPAGFAPSLVSAKLADAPLEIDALGPWTVKLPVMDHVLRDTPPTAQVGDLRVRVPELAARTQIDPWLQSFLVGGESDEADERTLAIAFGAPKGGGGLELVLSGTGVLEGDFVPRADDTRRYELYAETVSAR